METAVMLEYINIYMEWAQFKGILGVYGAPFEHGVNKGINYLIYFQSCSDI